MKPVGKTNKISTKTVSLFSRLNDRELLYYAILPRDYNEGSTEKFAVLYLLHGLFGRFDNWITNTNLIRFAASFPFIIICADGGDNWWTDNAEIENRFYESYLTEELIPDVERKFNARAERNSRAIAGLSMGGYGAFKLAFRRPEMFCLAASTSGALHAAEIFADAESNEWNDLQPSISHAFGAAENVKVRRENDLFRLARDFPAEQINRLPYFYFDCGASDTFLPINLRFDELLRQRKVPHEFRQFFGAHDWNYWNEQTRRILSVAENILTV